MSNLAMKTLYFLLISLMIFGCGSKEYPQVVEHFNKSEHILKGLSIANGIDYVFQFDYDYHYQDTFLLFQGYSLDSLKEEGYYNYEEPEQRTLTQIMDSLNQNTDLWMLYIDNPNHPATMDKLSQLSNNFRDLLQINFPVLDVSIIRDKEYAYWSQMLDVGGRKDILVEYYLIKNPKFELPTKEKVVAKAVLPTMKDKRRTFRYHVGKLNDSIHYRVLK